MLDVGAGGVFKRSRVGRSILWELCAEGKVEETFIGRMRKRWTWGVLQCYRPLVLTEDVSRSRVGDLVCRVVSGKRVKCVECGCWGGQRRFDGEKPSWRPFAKMTFCREAGIALG